MTRSGPVMSIAFTPGGKRAWVSGTAALVLNSTFPDNPARGTVAVINTRTLRVTSRIRVGTEPTGLAIDGRRNTAYVTNFQDDTVSYFATPK